ncbi:hypothetical protein [Savagea faecisuis]|uniref:Uncharacterized protein n=1 Tax=Savagea faecisuis TaxID=1274803 RepID=A0ABW3GT73_9BACL
MSKSLKVLSAAALAAVSLTPAAVANADTQKEIPVNQDGIYYEYNGQKLYVTVDELLTNSEVIDQINEVGLENIYLIQDGQAGAYQDFVDGKEVKIEDYDLPSGEYKDLSGNIHQLGDGNTEEPETPGGEVTVESVSAINANYVTVTINKADEDRLAQEVEVKDANGKVYPVKALDIAAGDTTAEFEFVTAVKAADLKGVWTVDGKAYDLDVFNKIAKVLAAKTQIELNTALTALDLDNYNAANITEYFAAQQKLAGTVEATDLTVADIQKLVDDANAKVEAGKDEKALIKAIKEAKDANNQVAFLAALNNAALEQVNPDWVAVEGEGYFTKITGEEADLKAIQTAINTANNTILNTSVTSEGIDKAKLTASKELIAQYAPLTDKGEIANTDVKTKAANIEIQLAVVDVLEATTPTALKNKLTALAELDKAKLDMKNYVDANGKAYVKAIADETDKATKLATTDQINTLLTTVNTAEAKTLVDAVNTAAKAVDSQTPTVAQQDALLKALKDLGLKQVADSNKAQYAKDASAFATESDTAASKTKEDVQTQVNTSNVTAVTSATDADDLLVALKILELKNVVDANKDAYLKDVQDTQDGTIKEAQDATGIDAALKAINSQVAIDAAVKAINEAKTATEVKTALDKLANEGKVEGYLNVTSADRIFIAEQVLDARDEIEAAGDAKAKEFADETAVGEAVTAATTARTNAIEGVNDLKLETDLTEIAAALLAVGHESLSGADAPTANDTNIADAFITSLGFDDEGAIKPQFRSIAEIRAAITKVVK